MPGPVWPGDAKTGLLTRLLLLPRHPGMGTACLIISGYSLLVLCLWDLCSFSHFLPFPSLQNQAMGNLRGSFLRVLSTVWCADRIPTNRRKWSCMAGQPISWKKRWTTSKMYATQGCFVFLSFLSFEAARRVGSEAWMGMLSRHFESLIWIGSVSLFLCGDAKGMGRILQQASLGWLLLTGHEWEPGLLLVVVWRLLGGFA